MSDEPCLAPLHDYLFSVVVTYLAAMLPGSEAQAKAAAIAMVRAFPVANPLDMIEVATMIAFKLASLASLRDANAETTPPPLAARLRANAATCQKIAARHEAALSGAKSQPAPRQERSAAVSNTQTDTKWAAAMLAEAEKCAANLAGKPATEQAAAAIWAKALRGASVELRQPVAVNAARPPPR